MSPLYHNDKLRLCRKTKPQLNEKLNQKLNIQLNHHLSLHWQQHPLGRLNQSQRYWLLGEGSLTRKLVDASDGAFSLQVLKQGLARPRLDEAKALGIKDRQLALVREIVMSGKGQAWVFARSVFPLTSLDGRLRHLKTLDNRPLGALLFNDPSMKRSPIEISLMGPASVNFPIQEACWARRSLFHLSDKPLLVSEVFLPTFDPMHQAR